MVPHVIRRQNCRFYCHGNRTAIVLSWHSYSISFPDKRKVSDLRAYRRYAHHPLFQTRRWLEISTAPMVTSKTKNKNNPRWRDTLSKNQFSISRNDITGCRLTPDDFSKRYPGTQRNGKTLFVTTHRKRCVNQVQQSRSVFDRKSIAGEKK